MRTLFVLGRAIFGGFFAYSGINHFQHPKAWTVRRRQGCAGCPSGPCRPPGRCCSPAASASSPGVKPRQGLAAIIAFLIPVTLQMHRFWEEQDARSARAR